MSKSPKLISEQEVLKKLDIPDWKHMNKQCVNNFVSELSNMEPEVAKAAMAQFPNFSELGKDIITSMRTTVNEFFDSADKNTEKAIQANEQILDGLMDQLNKPFLWPGERKKIIESIIEVSANIKDIHEQHGNHILNAVKQMSKVALGVVIIGAGILGININRD